MLKNILLYTTVFILLAFVLMFFNRVNAELSTYAELTSRHNLTHSYYQNLSRQMNSAAIVDSAMMVKNKLTQHGKLFFTDSLDIIRQLESLKSSVRDSINIDIAEKLDRIIRSELSWLIENNLPDSFKSNKAMAHVMMFQKTDSLINEGVNRTFFLISYRTEQLNNKINTLRLWTTLFITLSFLMLIFTTVNMLKQQSVRKRKELELALVLNRIRDGVVSVDKNWRYTFLNDAALATHPLGKKEMIGKVIWDVHPQMVGTLFWDKYHEAMVTKRVIDIDQYYEPMDIWFSVIVYPSENGLTIFFKDVTESKKSSQALLHIQKKIVESEKIYKTIASSIPGSVICLLDRDYRYLLIEGDMLGKLGYSKSQLLGKRAADVLSPELFASLEIQFKKVFKGQTVSMESIRSGYYLNSRYIPLKDENNNVEVIMTVAMDITDLKKAQNDINQLNRGLEEKIIKRTEQLKKSNEEMEAFSYSVSHDLRSPLRGIIGFAAILEEDYGGRLDAEGRRIISIIKNNTLKMSNLIDDLLSFSRMGKQNLLTVGVDTNALLAEIIGEQMQNPVNKRIKWNIQELPPVKVDVKTFQQVWINLISNAIKYSSNRISAMIEIGFFKKDNQYVFYVKDNGAGFNEAYKNKLYKVFQRLHNDDEFEGNGVGLAIVEKIITRHGGKVWAEGKVGLGACFYFSIPL